MSESSNTFNASPEKLVYFQHLGCGWWSIGDAPEREFWYCPWCGKRLRADKRAPMEVQTGEKE